MAINIKKEFGNTRQRKPDVTSLVYGKVPPQAPELEEVVLGAMLLEKDKIEDVFGIIPSEECFYVDANQKIYAAIKRAYNDGYPIDLLTIVEQLRKSNELEIIGGAYYLTRLTMAVTSSAHVEAHARIVMEKFIMREVIRISGQAIGDAYEDSVDVFELLGRVEKEFYSVSTANTGGKIKHIGQVVKENLDKVETQRNSEVEFTGVTSGYGCIDALTGGWQPTNLIIIAARPAVGKSAFVANLANNAASHPIYPAAGAIFSLEMSRSQFINRMTANKAGIPLDWITSPKRMDDFTYDKYQQVSNKLGQLPVFIDDTANLTIMHLRAELTKLKKKHNIKWAILDYLQLAKAISKQGGNREQEVSQISRDLKVIAKDLEIALIALAQLNRGIENRAENVPRLADLRESGSIEQDADLVCFLYKPSAKDIADDASLSDKVMFDIQKQRDGATGDMIFRFVKEYQRFEELEKDVFQGTKTNTPAKEYDNPYKGIYRNPSEPNNKFDIF